LMKLRSKPYLHNRVRSNLNKIFNVAIRQGLRMDNPAFGSEKSPEEARDRVLDDGEVSRLLEALDAAPGREADLIRLLYLTGSRPKELLSARWSDFILETSPDLPSIWEKPALTVKQRRKHKVELSDLAAATFKRMRDSHNDDIAKKKYKDGWVFPSRRGDDKHLTTYKKFWSKVATVAGLEDARTYDLRKSFASRILASGANIGTAMQLTGHTQAAIFLKHYVKPMQGKQTEALARVQWVPLPK
jgi:integrase